MTYIILICCGLGVVYSIIVLIRNSYVYKYRIWLIDEIYKLNLADIYRGDFESYRRRGRRRGIEYESVSYGTMVSKFWRPLNSFYEKTELFREIHKGLN